MFITDCFIRKWHAKIIFIPSTFVGLFCVSNYYSIFASWTAGRLFGWLLSYVFHWLVSWLVRFGWLVGFGSFWCWLTARLTAPRSFHSSVSQNTSPALITMAVSTGVSGHRKFEMLLIV